MGPTVLVPLRADGKSRLAPLLAPDARRALARAMASDVVDALRGAGLDRIVLVAGGPGAREVGEALGLEVLDDPPGTAGTAGTADPGPLDRAPALDRALSHAGRTVGGPTLIVAADLPALTADDLRAVLAAVADVVVAPTRGGGTAALLRRGGAAIAPAYGVDSATRHVTAARSAGLTVAVIERPGLAHDVDRPEDLTPPRGLAFGSATARLVSELGARPADG